MNYACNTIHGAGFARIFTTERFSASAAEQVTTSAFQGMEDALVGFVTTGKLDFASLVDSMIADLTRLSIRKAVLGPLAEVLSGGFPSARRPRSRSM